jgi:hypothetical protein
VPATGRRTGDPPAITFVIAASGLKYVGLGTTALGWTLCGILFAAAAVWLAYMRPRQNAAAPEDPDPNPVAPPVEPVGVD